MTTVTTVPKLHPAWEAFIKFCSTLKHGEIERLTIADGVPVIAQVVKEKMKFV